MDIIKLCDKSKNRVVQCAYMDLIDWNEPLTKKRIIEEIEYKLECAMMDGLDWWGFRKIDITNVVRFLKKIKDSL